MRKGTFFRHTSLKVYQGMEVYLHSFVISALDRGVCVVSRRFYFRGKSSRYPYRRADLDALKKGIFFALARIRILSRPAGSLVIIPTTLSRNFGNVKCLVNDYVIVRLVG
jgi:hypothetical protein